MKLFRLNEAVILSNNTRKNLHTVLNKMNSETIYASNGSTFSSDMTLGLALMDKNGKTKARLIDERFLVSPVSGEIAGKSKIEFNGKVYIIDNKTGEILPVKKGIFEKRKTILNNIETIINSALETFSNDKLAKKEKINIKGFTKAGVQKLMDANLK